MADGTYIPDNPQKTKEFDTYILWQSLPAMMRGKTPEELEVMGVNDPILIDLLQIKTQTQFAEKYKLAISTTSIWNRMIEEDPTLLDKMQVFTRSFFRKLSKEVYQAFYRETLKNGDAPRMKLWAQLMENWVEKSKVESDVNLTEDSYANLTPDEILRRSEANLEKLRQRIGQSRPDLADGGGAGLPKDGQDSPGGGTVLGESPQAQPEPQGDNPATPEPPKDNGDNGSVDHPAVTQ